MNKRILTFILISLLIIPNLALAVSYCGISSGNAASSIFFRITLTALLLNIGALFLINIYFEEKFYKKILWVIFLPIIISFIDTQIIWGFLNDYNNVRDFYSSLFFEPLLHASVTEVKLADAIGGGILYIIASISTTGFIFFLHNNKTEKYKRWLEITIYVFAGLIIAQFILKNSMAGFQTYYDANVFCPVG